MLQVPGDRRVPEASVSSWVIEIHPPALRLATGAGAANAAVIGAGFCTRDSILTLAERATVRVVRQRLNGELRFVYRHFPRAGLSSVSQRAAEAAEAAGNQGKFWPMHRLLLAHTQHLDDATIALCAATLELDMPRFLYEFKEGVYTQKVRQDFQSGMRSGVNSTPTSYINCIRHDDFWDVDTLLAAMQNHRLNIEDTLACGSRVEPRHALLTLWQSWASLWRAARIGEVLRPAGHALGR